MAHGRLVPKARVGSSKLRRNQRMTHRETLDVHFVDDGLRIAVIGPPAVTPTECLIHDESVGHVPGRVERTG
jgi:hypothetical protein